MKTALFVSQSPNKPNIFYCVNSKRKDIEEALHRDKTKLNRTIIFCKSYTSCISICFFFKRSIGKAISEPEGFPNLTELRIVDMFTACTHPTVKNIISKQFQQPYNLLCVTVATVAFGMGLDCPNVHRVIHWIPPEDVETYMQETGRAGLPATAKLFSAIKDSAAHVDDKMKDYLKLLDVKCRSSFGRNLTRTQKQLQFVQANASCTCQACKS